MAIIENMEIIMPCLDCGKETMGSDYYMVNDDLWYTYVPEQIEENKKQKDCRGIFLCWNCLQKRVGRMLGQYDLKNILMNGIFAEKKCIPIQT